MKFALLCCAGMALSIGAGAAGTGRYEEFTQKFAHAPDRAEIVSATLLGGAGTEWLTAGGFQPDGTIVAAGVTLGPDLEFGTKANILGNDTAMPPATRRPLYKNRQPDLDKSGRPKFEILHWNHPNATAFVVRLSPDLKSVKTVSRLGWRLGGLTDAAVDADGSIYICGPAGARIESVSDDHQALEAAASPGPGAATDGERTPAWTAVYIARLTSDTAKVQWVRTIANVTNAPSLRLGKPGLIHLLSADLRVIDAGGKQVSKTAIPSGGEGHIAINPVDSSWAVGGEHHWTTGREPYRAPVMNIHRPDGSLLYELYNWDGPLVGLNDLRLVSDTAIRGVIYDDEGKLILHAWTDGGSSVISREPNDIFTAANNLSGLGLNTSGAGVLSCAYIVRIDPKTYKVDGGTLWVGYLQDRDKPSSVTINSVGAAKDGSICVGGNAAWGLIRTGNAFPGEPAGGYVAVMSKDFKSLRFSSTVPGTGQIDLDGTSRWGVASGLVNGRPMAMFLSGAVEQEGDSKPPVANARQDKYGGGFADGHLLLLDLSGDGRRESGKKSEIQ